MVIISRKNPLSEENMMLGAVEEMRKTSITIALIGSPVQDLTTGVWRIDKVANQINFDRMCEALEGFFFFDKKKKNNNLSFIYFFLRD